MAASSPLAPLVRLAKTGFRLVARGGHQRDPGERLDSERCERQTFAPELGRMTGDGGQMPSDWQVYAAGKLTHA